VRELDSPCKLAYSAGRAEFMHPTPREARQPVVALQLGSLGERWARVDAALFRYRDAVRADAHAESRSGDQAGEGKALPQCSAASHHREDDTPGSTTRPRIGARPSRLPAVPSSRILRQSCGAGRRRFAHMAATRPLAHFRRRALSRATSSPRTTDRERRSSRG
jgi:hypothetical protein